MKSCGGLLLLCLCACLCACGDDSDGLGELGAPCSDDSDCQDGLICDVHDARGSCQNPHSHAK